MNRYSNAKPNTRAIITPEKPSAPFWMLTPAASGRLEKTGQNPAFISTEALLSLGVPTSPIKAIRARCVDCCGGAVSEVRKCTAFNCALWPYRMGKNPFHGNTSEGGDG